MYIVSRWYRKGYKYFLSKIKSPNKPGWYRDPLNFNALRYYDGQHWTLYDYPVKTTTYTSNVTIPTRMILIILFLSTSLTAATLVWDNYGTNLWSKASDLVENPSMAYDDALLEATDPSSPEDPPLSTHTEEPTPAQGQPSLDNPSEIDATTGRKTAPNHKVDDIATIEIPKIGVSKPVSNSVSTSALKKSPGHIPQTTPLGDPGNAVISGHRTTFGAPFRKLDNLSNGDKIYIKMNNGVALTYEVRATLVVSPKDTWVTSPTSGVRLTLTTCHPAGSDRQRLIIQAELVDGPNSSQATPADQW